MECTTTNETSGAAEVVPRLRRGLVNGANGEGRDPVTDYGKPVHPVCDIFPLMEDDALDALAADIKANGLNHPVVLHEGQIVDGRNRMLACRKAGVEPTFVAWAQVYAGTKPLIAWIWSENFERRHMTPQQKAFAIVARKGIEESQKARERQEASGKCGAEGGRGHAKTLPPKHGGRVSNTPSPGSKHYSGETRVVLAKEAGVSKDLIQRAMNVQKAAMEIAPDLVRHVAQGKVTVQEAEARLGLKAREEAPAAKLTPTIPAGNLGSNKRQEILNAAAKTRMINVLSQVRGFCANLARLNPEHIAAASTAPELSEWAGIAAEAAKRLRWFSSSLAAVKAKEKTA